MLFINAYNKILEVQQFSYTFMLIVENINALALKHKLS